MNPVTVAIVSFGFVAVVTAFRPYDNALPDFLHQEASGKTTDVNLPPVEEQTTRSSVPGADRPGFGSESDPIKPSPPVQGEQSPSRPVPGADQAGTGAPDTNKPANVISSGSGPRPSTGSPVRPVRTTTIKMKSCARGIKWPVKPKPPPKEADATNGFGCSVYPDVFSGVKDTCRKLTAADKKTGSYFWYCCGTKWSKRECI